MVVDSQFVHLKIHHWVLQCLNCLSLPLETCLYAPSPISTYITIWYIHLFIHTTLIRICSMTFCYTGNLFLIVYYHHAIYVLTPLVHIIKLLLARLVLRSINILCCWFYWIENIGLKFGCMLSTSFFFKVCFVYFCCVFFSFLWLKIKIWIFCR